MRVPPVTDVQELVSQYHSLFATMNIPIDDPFPASTMGFTHPIPEENERLKKEFFETMMILQGAMMQFKKFVLRTTRVQNTTVTFIFEYFE